MAYGFVLFWIFYQLIQKLKSFSTLTHATYAHIENSLLFMSTCRCRLCHTSVWKFDSHFLPNDCIAAKIRFIAKQQAPINEIRSPQMHFCGNKGNFLRPTFNWIHVFFSICKTCTKKTEIPIKLLGVSNKSCAVNNVSVFFSVALFLRSVPVKFLMCKFIYTIVFTLHKNSIQKDCDKTNYFRIRWSFHLRCKLYDVRSTTLFLQSKFHNPKNLKSFEHKKRFRKKSENRLLQSSANGRMTQKTLLCWMFFEKFTARHPWTAFGQVFLA